MQIKKIIFQNHSFHYLIIEKFLHAHFLIDNSKILFAIPNNSSGISVWYKGKIQLLPDTLKIQTAKINEFIHFTLLFQIKLKSEAFTIQNAIAGGIRFIRNFNDTKNAYPHQQEFSLTFLKHFIKQDKNNILIYRNDSYMPENFLITLKLQNKLEFKNLSFPLILKDQTRIKFKFTGRVKYKDPLFPYTADFRKKILSPEAYTLFSYIRNQKLNTLIDNLLFDIAFLSYKNKLLAGSYKFLTYFGRDTLLFLHILRKTLSNKVFLAGLNSVISRVNNKGEVAHEENIGEWLIYERLINPSLDTHDYKMIDDDFLLPIVMNDFLKLKTFNTMEKLDFLKKIKDKLVLNINFILNKLTLNFPIKLKKDSLVGDWRDSEAGLGFGLYPFSVNIGFSKKSLDCIHYIKKFLIKNNICKNNDFINFNMTNFNKKYKKLYSKFKVKLNRSEIQDSLTQYFDFLSHKNIHFQHTIENLPDNINFFALSLDKNLQPLKILHTDIVFLIEQLPLNSNELTCLLDHIFLEFPYGLYTDIGFIIANPAYTNSTSYFSMFDDFRYHGTVIWGFQNNYIISTILQKIANTMLLTSDKRKKITKIFKNQIDILLKSAEELWSFEYKNNKYIFKNFYGETDSNSVQLWSCTFLGAIYYWLKHFKELENDN